MAALIRWFDYGSSDEYPPFDAHALPSQETMAKAAELEVFDEEGEKVKFGSLIEKKVVVVFIRTSSRSSRITPSLNALVYARAFLLWSKPLCSAFSER